MSEIVSHLTPSQRSDLLLKLLESDVCNDEIITFCRSRCPAISTRLPTDRRRKDTPPTEKKANDPAFWDVEKLKEYVEHHHLEHLLPERGTGTRGKLVKPDYLFAVRTHKKELRRKKRSRDEMSSISGECTPASGSE